MATMRLFPPPTPSITPIGVFVHISQITNFTTNSGIWTPSDVTLETPLEPDPINYDVYQKLDWSRVPLDKNDPEVQEIINPDINKINQKIVDAKAVTDLEKSAATQLNNVKTQIIDDEVRNQGLNEEPEGKEVKSGYRTLDKLLKIAGDLAPKLGKNKRVKYENLRRGYIKDVHGLCPQGTQAVVAALTGINQLGRISGHADWFSFKSPGTGTALTGASSFAIDVGGTQYYHNKVKVSEEWIKDPTKWQVGDVIAQGYTSRSYGHIQVWTGFAWVSDFTQSKVQTSGVDFDTVALWRLNENGIAAVESQKIG
jgi:hypothetical protein